MNAPYDYRVPYRDRVAHKQSSLGYREYSGLFRALNCDNNTSWRQLSLILAGIDSLSRKELSNVNPISRVEIFLQEKDRGMVLYDTSLRPIIHIVHALLGYDGSGPTLTKLILTTLGVSEAMFSEANDATRSSDDYSVVFSREKIGEFRTVDSALPYGKVGQWDWWYIEQ